MALFVCKSQETIVPSSNFNYKVGVEYISEYTTKYFLKDTTSYHTNSFGLPFLIRLGKTKSSIETGVFYINKKEQYALDYYHSYNWPHYYIKKNLISFHYLRVPINYRFDTKLLYISAGLCIDNLLSMTNKSDTMDVKESFPDRKFKMGVNLKIGIEKDFAKQFSVFLEVRFSTDINKAYFRPGFLFVNGEPIQNFGFGIGINHKIARKKKMD